MYLAPNDGCRCAPLLRRQRWIGMPQGKQSDGLSSSCSLLSDTVAQAIQIRFIPGQKVEYSQIALEEQEQAECCTSPIFHHTMSGKLSKTTTTTRSSD